MSGPVKNIPGWLKKRLIVGEAGKNIRLMKDLLAEFSVNTVCESSLCPNLNECFSGKLATFMILGSVCTRRCSFCSVEKKYAGQVVAAPVDMSEPGRILNIVRKIDAHYAIITSVTRDDLADGGAKQFSEVTRLLKVFLEGIKVEVLVPDFNGSEDSVKTVLSAGPDIFGHNIETVRRLYQDVRPGADYIRSMNIFRLVKNTKPGQLTKSSVMVGLGESEEEVRAVMCDLKNAGCDMLTIGQYLSPRKSNYPVKRFVRPEEFERYREFGEKLGFLHVYAGPFIRSSYHSEDVYKNLEVENGKYCSSAAS